ncbi:MAG: hypothetical protein ACQEQO_08390 [Thermodesulfobacteriota bacterium]
MVQKREYVNEVNNVPEIPIYRGHADRAKFISGGLTHEYIAEKTNPRASASGPEGTEKKPIVFRSIGAMQRFLRVALGILIVCSERAHSSSRA